MLRVGLKPFHFPIYPYILTQPLHAPPIVGFICLEPPVIAVGMGGAADQAGRTARDPCFRGGTQGFRGLGPLGFRVSGV